MKKFGSMLLMTLCLTMVLTTMAFATYTYDGVTYADGGDITTTGFNDEVVPTVATAYAAGDGFLYYIPETTTTYTQIILDNATISVTGAELAALDLFYITDITLVGESTLSSEYYTIWSSSIEFYGDGSLEIFSTGNHAICCADLFMYSGNVTANTDANYAIDTLGLGLYGGTLTTEGEIYVTGSVTVVDTNVLSASALYICPESGYSAIYCDDDEVFDNMIVYLDNYYSDGSLSIQFYGDVNLDYANSTAFQYADYYLYYGYNSYGDISFADGSTVTIAEGTIANFNSFALYTTIDTTVVNNGTLYLWESFFDWGADEDITIINNGTVYLGFEIYDGFPSSAETTTEVPTEVTPAATATATPNASTIYVNGEVVEFDAYTINENNYLKLRDLAYILSGTEVGFEVTWDQALGIINLESNAVYTEVSGEMAQGDGTNQTAVANTSPIYMDGELVDLAAYTINENNYLKLRDLGELFGFNVSWVSDTNSETNSIIINTSEAYTAD